VQTHEAQAEGGRLCN